MEIGQFDEILGGERYNAIAVEVVHGSGDVAGGAGHKHLGRSVNESGANVVGIRGELIDGGSKPRVCRGRGMNGILENVHENLSQNHRIGTAGVIDVSDSVRVESPRGLPKPLGNVASPGVDALFLREVARFPFAESFLAFGSGGERGLFARPCGGERLLLGFSDPGQGVLCVAGGGGGGRRRGERAGEVSPARSYARGEVAAVE